MRNNDAYIISKNVSRRTRTNASIGSAENHCSETSTCADLGGVPWITWYQSRYSTATAANGATARTSRRSPTRFRGARR